MGKRGRKERRRALFASAPSASVPGGMEGVRDRAANGRSTPQDVDFVTRITRERQGLDGYSGKPKSGAIVKGSAGSFPTQGPTHPSQSQRGMDGRYSRQTGFTFHTTQPKEDGVFRCEDTGEITGTCPLNPNVPDILIDAQMWNCLMDCTRAYDTEWIALLIGKLDKNSKGEPAYVIDKFYFPPQTASGTHVDVPTGVKPKPGTIGAIHSHVGMGVFFSATDKDHSNWPVEIVINRKEDYEAVAKYQLKCGEWAKTKATVYLTGTALPKAVKAQLDAAFVTGRALEAKSSSKGTAGVHPEDRPTYPSYPSSAYPYWTAGQGQCGNCYHYTHVKGQACSALQCTCKEFKPTSGASVVCPVSDCVREKGHGGMHRNGRSEYYTFTPGEGKVADPNPPTPATETTTALATTTVNPDDPTEIVVKSINEEDCAHCSGEGMVEEFDVDKGTWDIRDCEKCKGTGLSALGIARKAEDYHDLLHGYTLMD